MMWVLLLIVLICVIGGAVLADRLMPQAMGEPSHALPVAADATELDRVLTPLLAEHPGQSGALLMNDGLDAFAARALATRSAGRSLDLQYYAWHDDLCGRLLALEAWQAAERGVRVRMLLDDMNASGLDQQFLSLDAHPNIEIRMYNPWRNRTGIRRLFETLVRALRVNHRMHNKSWIADGRVAVVGGRNIGEEYFNAAPVTNFRDLDLLLMGPAVAGAEAVFDQYWNSDQVVPLGSLGKRNEQRLQQLVTEVQQQAQSEAARTYLARVQASPGVGAFFTQQLQPFWSDKIEVVADPPQKWRKDDREPWLISRLAEVIGSARTTAWLISPYFVPGDAGTQELQKLARNGAAVGVVTNSLAANDVPAVHAGYSRYRKPLLTSGVDLYELRAQGNPASAGLFGSSGASLHTKAFVIDGSRGFIGSFNLDPRSAMLNTEMGVLFDDPGLGAALQAEYQRLAGPVLSYEVELTADGALRWQDATAQPPQLLDQEPEASASRRAIATVLRWLPIETQL